MDLYNEKNALSFTLKMDTQVLKSLVLCTGALGVKYLVSVLATVIPNRECCNLKRWMSCIVEVFSPEHSH